LLKTKRIYDGKSEDDGFRILVDRLWPRGMSKEKAKVDLWLKDIAPSNELRKSYAHDEARWNEFKQKYREELAHEGDLVDLILQRLRQGNVTLLYGARNRSLNNAVALYEYIKEKTR
jgi:uncharacterized protein YeaO (DUF488 family)